MVPIEEFKFAAAERVSLKSSDDDENDDDNPVSERLHALQKIQQEGERPSVLGKREKEI